MKRQADAVLAVAGAELRVAWRSVRLWVGVLTLAGLTVGLFGFYAYVHAANPVSHLASATLAPRFLIAHLGAYPLAFALVLVVALLYDAETRDERAGVADALNARPVSNEALCAGRLLGAALCGWGALVFALALAQGLGLAARGANWWMGDAIEPVSLAAFAFLDAPPAIALMAALTLFLAAALRRRAFVMAAASILLLGALGGSHLLPARLYDALLPIFDAAGFASDLAPRFHDPSSLAQRGAMLLATAGLAFAAAGLSPRLPQRHGKRRRSLIIGIAFFSAGALALAMVGFAAGRDGKQRQEWLAEHRAAAAHAAAIRLRQVRGGVRINPGVELSLELELQVEALAQTDELVFSFNPGMRIENLDADGLASFTHRQGLLDVRLAERLRAGERHALTIRAAGVPAAGFAYLDSVLDRRRVQHGNRLWRLGGEASLFDANYVALMPGVRWLPTPGANLETNGQRGAFEVDLTVGAPCGWRVAGPGRPRPVESPSPSGEETGCPAFAFRPGAPVSNFALFASRFERRAAMFGDVEVALLASRDHMPHLERLAGDGAELTAEIEALFAAARQAGIPYPYDGLTVVEVPMRLRAYGGGWRLAAAFDLPGVLPIREAVALARFERRLALFGGLSGDASAARRRMLREWGRSDRHGGDLARGFAFNAFGAVANAASAGDAETFQHLAYGLLILPPYLAHHLPTNPFSAHVLNVQAPFGAWAGEMATDVLGMRNVSAQSNPRVDGPDVWERAATLSLATPKVARQDAVEAARAAAAMALKAGKTAGAILDTLGHARAAALLAQLRRRFAGEPIPADWAAELEALPSDLAAVVDDWLHGKALPGIVASTARFSRFAAPGGPERHRARLRLFNGSQVWALAFVSEDPQPLIAGAVRTESTPIPPGEAIEAQLVTPKRPRQLWLHSWLSRNQEPIALTLREARGDEMPEEFVSSRPSDWRPSPSSAIVVDDLDSGFSVADLARRRPAVYGPRRYDRGLPAFEYSTREVPGAWYRWGAPTAWGRFRRTVAQLIPGRKDRQLAVFSARLPGTPSGRWRLDYHIPWRLPPPTFAHLDHVGQTRLTIQTAAGNPVATVESDFVAGGWNVVGVFDVPEGDVEVRVSGSSDASLVVADAIRWSRNEEDKETQSG